MSAKPFVFDTDVLIIGGGFSGSWAALTARQHVENVLIVDKGPRDWGGLGGMSGGDMIVKQPEFAAKDLVEELVYYYDGLCEQDVLEEILNQSYERFKDYEKMGHEFARDDSGRLMSIPQRGLELMRYYFYHPYGKGGAHTTQILNAELQRLNVQRIGRIEITDLVKDGDAVSGAVGFHAQSGTPCLFRAKAVILAAHNGGWKGSYLLNTCAGEGAALAYGAGASLRNMEFIENWNVPKLFAWEGQTGMLPYGARFLNGEGEDFMRRYSPKLGAKADPHYNVRGMAFEVRAGRGPIYFDTSTMSPEGVEIMTPTGGWMKLNDTKLKELGIDFFKSKTEWMPQVLTSFGGTVADKDGWSGVPGLFVAGRARSVTPGVYMGGWDTCKTTTTGYIAGNSAGKYVSGLTSAPRFDDAHASGTLDATLSLLGKPGVYPKDVVRLMQELMAPMDVCILKTGKGLTRSLERLEDAKRNILPYMTAPEPHYLVKLVEARSMALITEMYLKASLMRKESRSGHYREDFPERLPEHLFGPPELTGEAGGVRPDRAERGHVRVRQQEQQRELALVGKLADFGVVPDARRYLTVFHHLSSRMASGAALPSPLNLKCSFNFSAPFFRSLAPRDETPAKRQRRADDAGLAPDWAGQGVPSAGAQPRAGSRKRALSHVRNG